MAQEALKRAVAKAAVSLIQPGMILGVGSGSTVNCFIEELAAVKGKLEACVASSKATAERLKALNIPLIDLNSVNELPLYIDGADEINPAKQMIKGGGGALTSEKIVAAVAKEFVCIADQSKRVDLLGGFPLAIEVIPMARSYVAREIVKLGGVPIYRQGFVTDHGNVIIDVHHLKIQHPVSMEELLNNIAGIVAHGLFAKRPANQLWLATPDGIKKYE